MAIELRIDLDPNMVENFRELCTNVKDAGAKGLPFVYEGFMTNELVPKGHIIIINYATNGTRIYRSQFDDDVENPTPQVP